METSLEQIITWHLTGRFYPSIPTSMVKPCLEAIKNAKSGDWDLLVNLPEGITFKGSTQAPTIDIIQAHRLEAWAEEEEGSLCEICEGNPVEYPDSKWCDSCKIDYKQSEVR
jgi:hypothetical protein